MKLQHLSVHTGVPVSTVKFYLRGGLLPPGEKLNATTARYDRRHVERLELIRDLRQVLGMSLGRVREAVESVDTEDPVTMMGRIQTIAFGVAVPSEDDTAENPPDLSAEPGGRLTSDEIVRAMGWLPGTASSMVALDSILQEMAGWGMSPGLDSVLVYARAADSVASTELALDPDVDDPPSAASPDRLARFVALGVHSYSRLLLRLLAVAQGSYARHRWTPAHDRA